MIVAGEDDDVVVGRVSDQLMEIEGHHSIPVRRRQHHAIEAPWIDEQTTVSIFPNVLYEA